MIMTVGVACSRSYYYFGSLKTFFFRNILRDPVFVERYEGHTVYQNLTFKTRKENKKGGGCSIKF